METEFQIKKCTYSSIDLAKFVFAISIVLMHTQAMTTFSENLNSALMKIFYLLAVPFFFVTSGYFLGLKLEFTNADRVTIKKYVTRMLKPYLIFCCIGLILEDINRLSSGTGFIRTILANIRALIFYPYASMWFIWACIVAAIVLLPFIVRDKLIPALLISLAGYAFCLLTSTYYGLTRGGVQTLIDLYLKICVSGRNGIFEGMIFILSGILIARYEYKLSTLFSMKRLTIVTGIAYLVYLAEVLFTSKNIISSGGGAVYITYIFLMPLLFLLVKNVNIGLSDHISVYLRNLSSGIYYLQKNLIVFLYMAFPVIKQKYFLTFIIVISVSIILSTLSYHSKNKFIRSLLK